MEVDHGTIVQQLATGAGAELLAQQKVAIAMHDKTGHTSTGQGTQLGLYLRIGRVGIIVADPEFKQVSQDVQLPCLTRFTAQEAYKLRRNLRLQAIQMDVGDK